MRKAWALCPVLLMIVLAVPAVALSAPVVIPYGRSWPLSLVVDSSRGLVYVDGASGIYPPTGFTFGVINTTDDSVRVLPLKVTPGDIAFDAGRDNVYVAGSSSIAVYSGGTGAFVRNLSLGHPILHMAFDTRASHDLYVTSGKSVYEMDPETGSVVANAGVSGAAGGLVLDPSDGRLFVADYLSRSVSAFQASGLVLVGTISLQSCCPDLLALDPASKTLYATTGTNYLAVIDEGTDAFRRNIAVVPSSANSTASLAVDPGTGRIFVSFSTGGSIAELSPDGSLLGFLQVTSTPASMGVDTSTGKLYVTNYHQITAFDAREGGANPDYTLGFLAAAGAAVAAVALIMAVRTQARRNRSKS